MPASPTQTGFYRDRTNGRLDFYYAGTRVGGINATTFSVTGGVTATTSIAATTTLTAGTGLTVTTGNYVVSAGDHRVTAGNARLGAVEAFANTEPTSAYVMNAGTAPEGAITTSGGVFTDGTTMKKIIADGTASDIET